MQIISLSFSILDKTLVAIIKRPTDPKEQFITYSS